MPGNEQKNYDSLVAQMEMRYSEKHRQQVYYSQLLSGRQKCGETLQEFQDLGFEADIARLIFMVYFRVLARALEFQAAINTSKIHAHVRKTDEEFLDEKIDRIVLKFLSVGVAVKLDISAFAAKITLNSKQTKKGQCREASIV